MVVIASSVDAKSLRQKRAETAGDNSTYAREAPIPNKNKRRLWNDLVSSVESGGVQNFSASKKITRYRYWGTAFSTGGLNVDASARHYGLQSTYWRSGKPHGKIVFHRPSQRRGMLLIRRGRCEIVEMHPVENTTGKTTAQECLHKKSLLISRGRSISRRRPEPGDLWRLTPSATRSCTAPQPAAPLGRLPCRKRHRKTSACSTVRQ